jgi:osmoprotectant transport system ATP-binding protein
MIRLENLTKRYAEGAGPAVEAVSMEAPEGQTVALIGPSGCGKTTTLRMINRLIEPTSGRIFVNGEDVTAADPVTLRRRIGYVIQSVGLFPHMTVAQNIAVVPKLLGWAEAKISARTDELLDLVGLDPAITRPRYPRQLSGGQRQRIGVARALAADPPVLLMDEPFGAIDPVARLRIQEEFRQILSKVKKTVVIVTHDLDEAIRLGDRLAIMRAGRLVQYDTPAQILSHPADDFVANFIGADGPLKRLGLIKVDGMLSQEAPEGTPSKLMLGASLRDALTAMIASNSDAVAIEDGAGRLQGYVHRKAIFAA